MGGLAGGRLIGRDAESARLYAAMTLAAQGEPQVVLVAGDAGIGKTGLVSDLVARAAELGFVTAVGHCLDIEASMSFAPVIEAVRTLVARDIAFEERPQARRMTALLDPGTPEPDRVRMLDDLRLTILEAASLRPLLLLIEDMHWTDRSTQDLVSAVARTAHGRLLLVLTVRTDELHRRHAFRPALAELGRLENAQRIDLRPLGREDVGELLRARSGSLGDAQTVSRIHERSEGNPLYAEELIDADPDVLPEHLSDLLLARVAGLTVESRTVVRAASVDGSLLDTEVLAAIGGHDADSLETLLRQAIDVHVLRQRGNVLEFRHGLLREAVYDDLLPGERTRIHAAFAEALQTRVDAGGEASLSELSRLAFHWSKSHDPARTLAASVRAGTRALHFGTAEAVTHLERAVSLWERVAEPENVTSQSKPDVLLLLARAHADDERRDLFEVWTRQAVAELRPDTDPLVASRVYATLTLCEPAPGDEFDEAEALRLALEYAGDTPSRELANALASKSTYHHRRGHGTAALEAAQRAARVARQAGDAESEVQTLHFCAIEHDLLGHVGEAIATEAEAVRVARKAGRLGHALFAESNLAWFQLMSGAAGPASDRAVAGAEESLANGLPVLAVYCGTVAFTSLVWRGHFSDAARMLDRLTILDAETHWPWQEDLRQKLAVAQGDLPGLADRLDEPLRFVATGFHHGEDPTQVDERVTLLLALDREAAAGELAERYLRFLEGTDSPVRHAFAAFTAYRAAIPQREESLRSCADRALDQARPHVTDEWGSTLYGLWFAMAEGLCSRFRGEPAAARLREAVAIGVGLGSYVALEPRLLLAEELLAHGEREEGKELLTSVWSDARAMGAGDFERRAFKLATRTRVPLPHKATGSGPLARLTPREREVLDLLADGATNRTIAETLFITEKTASVHVSNLLAKLGVPNRGAAAALARRLG